jgi:hypothetical protein
MEQNYKVRLGSKRFESQIRVKREERFTTYTIIGRRGN